MLLGRDKRCIGLLAVLALAKQNQGGVGIENDSC